MVFQRPQLGMGNFEFNSVFLTPYSLFPPQGVTDV
jgi:hypothetical protein